MTIPAKVIRQYRQYGNVFVETGTHLGDSVRAAINAGFRQIYTIELAPHFFKQCQRKFASNKQVECVFGDSTVKLPEILSKINEPAVFWLDGHWSEGSTAKGDKPVPLYEELEAIAKHHIKNHVLLIDDIRLMGTEWKDISLDRVQELCLKINDMYHFSYENGYVPNDILVAQV